jgi:hypothetical protein
MVGAGTKKAILKDGFKISRIYYFLINLVENIVFADSIFMI